MIALLEVSLLAVWVLRCQTVARSAAGSAFGSAARLARSLLLAATRCYRCHSLLLASAIRGCSRGISATALCTSLCAPPAVSSVALLRFLCQYSVARLVARVGRVDANFRPDT